MSKTNDLYKTEMLPTSELLSSEILRESNYTKKKKCLYNKKRIKREKGRKEKKTIKCLKKKEENEILSQKSTKELRSSGSVCIDFSSEMLSDFDGMMGAFEKNAVSFINLPEKKYCKLGEGAFFFSDDNSSEKNVHERQATKSLDQNIYDGSKLSSLTLTTNHIINSKPFKHWTLDKKRSKNYSVPNFIMSNKENRKLNSLWDDYNAGVCCSLPILKSAEADSLMRISVDTVNEILNGIASSFKIIDCRFDYEYKGGHIKTGININTTDQMDSFYKENTTTILIFHCEYSSIRAPRMARYLRNIDRKYNDYPDLKFPEIYIMEGGYKLFYEKFNASCTPMHYTSMDDANESVNCYDHLNKRFS